MLDSTSFVFLISIVAFFIFIKRKLKSRRTFKFIEISQNEKEALIEGEKAFTFTCYHENTASHLELVDVVLSDHHLLWSPLSSSPRKWKVIKNEEMLGSKVVNNGYIDVHAEGQRERLLYDINQRDLNCDFANKISRKGAYQVIVYAYAESNRKYFKDGLMIQQSQTNIINMSNNGSAPASTSWFLKMFSILNSQFSRFAELVLFGDRSSSHSKHHLLLSFLYSSNPSNPNSSSSSSSNSSSSSSLLSSEGGAEMPSYNSSASMKLSSLRFHRLILHSIAKSYFPSSSQILLHSHRNSVHIPDAPEKRKVMFIVNPVSGNKRGKIIAEMMWPFLSASSDLIDYRLIYTQRSQHGKEIAKQFDYKEYKAVVCIGGDGMIFEVINGIMERENGEEVMKEITLGIIPAGTGNGIAASLDISSVEDAVLRILRGHSNPMDIMKVHQDHGLGDIYCCLQASYGMMADVDFDSEKLRFLGELRFPLYAMYLIFFLRRYPLKLKFKPSYVKRTENKKLIFEETNEEIEFNARFLWLGGLNTKYIAKDFMGAPNAHLDDGLVHILILPIIQNKLTLFELLWQMPEGKHVTNDNIKLFGTKSFELIPEPFMNRPIRLDVDGECIPILPSVPVYVESLPAFCNIFV